MQMSHTGSQVPHHKDEFEIEINDGDDNEIDYQKVPGSEGVFHNEFLCAV